MVPPAAAPRRRTLRQLWHELTLRPFDFFDKNPAIDASRES
jgi:Cu2+-containing amine oxidase